MVNLYTSPTHQAFSHCLCSVHLIDGVVVRALAKEHLHHVVVPARGGHVKAGLAGLVRDLQREKSHPNLAKGSKMKVKGQRMMVDLEEGGGAAEEESDDAGEAAHGGEVQGGVAEGLARRVDLQALTGYFNRLLIGSRCIYWAKGFFRQMLSHYISPGRISGHLKNSWL